MNPAGWAGRALGLAAKRPIVVLFLICFVAWFPGFFTLPPLDRDESRFAQATKQMLETGDFVSIKLQDQPRDKKPVGIYWLQALSTDVLSSPEARQIWAYRVPSLLGAMLAAAACAWGAAAFFGAETSLIAGASSSPIAVCRRIRITTKDPGRWVVT